MGKVVEIDCEKPVKLETSPKVTKRSLHWCRSISKKYLCRFYYSISQKVITLSGRRFITASGVLLHYRAIITLSGVFLLHYRAVITVSGVYYIIGWYKASPLCSAWLSQHSGSPDICMDPQLYGSVLLITPILYSIGYICPYNQFIVAFEGKPTART